MNLLTKVSLPKVFPKLSHDERWLMLGSCFVERMGEKLKEAKFNIDINPFGILYNPLSIARCIDIIDSDHIFTADDLIRGGDMWHSMLHHGSFSSPNKEETLELINKRLLGARKQMESLNGLIITFGTAWVYEQDGNIVGNCHKFPEKSFFRYRLSVEDIVNSYKQTVGNILAKHPELKIIFTVSPIRHIRDGLHENAVSKSTLLLAIDELSRLFPKSVSYFPSYEIALDELRDYRFYADDMVHLTSLAENYIWERFSEVAFSKETKLLITECNKISSALSHRPLHPNSSEYVSFLSKTLLNIEEVSRKYPYLVFEKEKELCRTALKKYQKY